MKLTKKLIPAIAMLMFSAVMLVTSSFAWFSMNKEVSATGMSVKAQGKQIYLQIVAGSDNFVDGGKQIEASAKTPTNSGTLLPTNVKAKADKSEYVNGEFVWVTAEGMDAENGTKNGAYTEVTTETEHYIKNTFKIRLDPTAGSERAEAALNVDYVNFTNQASIAKTEHLARSVSVLVVCTYDVTNEGSTTTTTTTQLYTQADVVDTNVAEESLPAVGTFTKTAGDDALTEDPFTNPEAGYVTVDIYVFFNGDSKHCTLAELGKATLNNYSVTVGFTVAEQDD